MSNTLEEVRKVALELINKEFAIVDCRGLYQKVTIGNIGYVFQFDNAKRRFGCCNYTTKVISLSKHLCEANPNQIHGKITDTILHEIAHAICVHLYGTTLGRGHNKYWKSIAKQIGSNGKRCYDTSDFGGITTPQSKYTLTCPTCLREVNRHRKPKRNHACANCCTNGYDPKHKLVITQNY